MITTVAAKPDDEFFLFQLYSLTRQDELLSWGWGEQEKQAFLSMQWRAQTMSYAAAYPNGLREIVQQQQAPVGQLYTSCHGNRWLLIDISLLPEYRNQGIGSSLIQRLQEQARRAEANIQLSVLPMSSAAPLYYRLGFRHVSSSGLHHILEWSYLHNDNDNPNIDAEGCVLDG